MFDVFEDVLRLQSTAGKLPLTLVVLDEMQQYIGDDNDKALHGAEHRGGLLGPLREPGPLRGRPAKRAHRNPTLQKLIDRFAGPGRLSDNDVETVVREVVLRKKPEVPTS